MQLGALTGVKVRESSGFAAACHGVVCILAKSERRYRLLELQASFSAHIRAWKPLLGARSLSLTTSPSLSCYSSSRSLL
jgi:hypothetical protein